MTEQNRSGKETCTQCTASGQDKSYLIRLVNSQKRNLCPSVVMKSYITKDRLCSVSTGKKVVTMPSCLEVCICLTYDLNYNNIIGHDVKLMPHCEQ